MESAKKGPGVTLGKLGVVRDELTGRLEVLGPGKVVRGPWLGVQATCVVTHKDGQRRLLRVALKELKTLAGRGLEKDTKGVNGRWAANAQCF